MRIPSLCCVLFVCVSALSLGQEQSKNKNDQPAAQLSPASRDAGFNIRPEADDSDLYCAYIRAYRVRREYKHSDMVAPAGYTTCVPTKRMELKSAVQIQVDPSQ
jgi:hypothetical protein